MPENKYAGHTPAPWEVQWPADGDPWPSVTIYAPCPGCDCGQRVPVGNVNADVDHPTWDANARLIADAPVLLSALREREEEVARLREAAQEAKASIMNALGHCLLDVEVCADLRRAIDACDAALSAPEEAAP